MRALLLSALLAGCAGSVQSPPPTVAGEVVAVDVSPMAYDGNATLDVRTEAGPTVRVEVPARTNLCQAALGALGEVRVGDRVEVRGERSAAGVVTPCTDPTHYLRVVERASPASETFRGVVTVGFEASAFSPCDRPGDVWWLMPDEVFADQLGSIRQQHVTDPGRATRLVVEATVVGALGPEPDFGYLGYEQRLTVTETRDMVFLAVDPEERPACR